MLLKPRCFVLHTFIYAKPTNVQVFLRLVGAFESLFSPQSPTLKLLESPLTYPSFPQAVTLMKKSGESLTVKPQVNLSVPISEFRQIVWWE